MSYVKVFTEAGTRTTCMDGSAFSRFASSVSVTHHLRVVSRQTSMQALSVCRCWAEMNGGEAGIDCGGPCPGSCPTGMEGDSEPCVDPLPGEPCRVNVDWALTDGLVNNPEW